MNAKITNTSIMIAPCGMDCMACYVHLKKKKPCEGCLCDGPNKPERCRSCKIKTCAQERDLLRCHECEDFPCKLINNLDKSYQKRYQISLIENSLNINKKGLESFFKDEKKRWTCKECGGIISLHDKICSECDKKLK